MEAVIAPVVPRYYKNKIEYNRIYNNKRYETDPEFRTKVKLGYYKRRYADDEVIQSIIEQKNDPIMKYRQIVQYLALKNSS